MREKTTHILNASSNLLGFCFFVLVSIKTFTSTFAAFIDEVVAMTIFLLAVSCFFSFLSIREYSGSEKWERYAEYLFIVALVLIVIVSSVFIFDHITN